jgi:hypothetical protein
VDQVAVRGVDLDDVHSRRGAPGGRGAERAYHLGDFPGVQRPRGLPAERHGRRRDRLEARDRRIGDPAGVVQLHADQGALGVHRLGQRAQAGHDVVPVRAELAHPPPPVRAHIRGFGEDQRRATGRTGAQILQVAVGDPAVGRAVVAFHRRADHPIAQLDRPNGERRAEQRRAGRHRPR